MYVKKITSFCKAIKRCTQKKIGSFFLPHCLHRCSWRDWRPWTESCRWRIVWLVVCVYVHRYSWRDWRLWTESCRWRNLNDWRGEHSCYSQFIFLLQSVINVNIITTPLICPFNDLFSEKTWVSRYQKGKASLDWNEARFAGVWGCSGISWTTCKQSAPRSRQMTNWIFAGRMLF